MLQVLIVGNGAVGKSSMIQVFTHDEYDDIIQIYCHFHITEDLITKSWGLLSVDMMMTTNMMRIMMDFDDFGQ